MKSTKSNFLPILAVLGGNVIFGFSFLFSKLALDLVEPTVLVAIRFSVAFLLLNLIVLINRLTGSKLFQFSLKGKPKRQILLLALCQPVIYFAGESYGIKLTSSSFAGIIIALIPLVGIVADALIMRTKIGPKQIICAVLSVFGVVLTTIGAEDLGSSAVGLILLLVAVISGAMFYVFSKKSGTNYNPLEQTYVMFGVGSAVYVVIALIQSIMFNSYGQVIQAVATPDFWGCIAYLAILSSVVAFLFLNYGSKSISVSKATLMANSTTVISILAGVFILQEEISIPRIIGAVIIIISVTIR